MSAQPVLLRRTTSNVPPSEPGAPSAVVPQQAPGSGGKADFIPIADEDPGDWDPSASKHKRKISDLPHEAEYNRASVKTSLELISDEEEGGNMDDCASHVSNSEFSDFPPFDGGSGGGGGSRGVGAYWIAAIRHSLSTSRGVAGLALLAMAIAFVVSRSAVSSPSSSSSSMVINSPLSSKPNPDSKDVTYGEFHEETVGAPMEHYAIKYNNILFYDSPDKMKRMLSKGPKLYDETVGGGLHLFEDVCLTNNVEQLRYRPQDTALRGLIYFTGEYDDNPRRCVPCSNVEPLGDWDADEQHSPVEAGVVGHRCGMPGLHAMFASSVGDWTDCIMEDGNARLMEERHQTQAPLNVTTIHFFQKPTFLLQFNALDMEKSLFDMLLTYLPHWQTFMEGAEDNKDGFPFDGVISHSLEGCLSHSHNWFCEVLHQMSAFGHAKEIPWENDENTLYCYTELFYNQVGYQRDLDHEGLVTKETFLEFRELLFRKLGLPRRPTLEDRLADAEVEKMYPEAKRTKTADEDLDEADVGDDTKIIFYDNKLGDNTARGLEKYQNIKFVTVTQNFADMTVAQQAKKFNEADAIIMAHGKYMANAIFSVDGTSFVEVGCKVESLIGNPRFMDLIGGKYFSVQRCNKKKNMEDESATLCVICKEEGGDMDFTMTPEAFEQLIDAVVAGL
ncbi:hypothetical protein ACHAXA_008328 [Cyclostephanos tholiformis]|uniref:Glycosyltransferase 61 catalytic domain-containing protein n=1 Tax=Cyclostephanos tholiformis TaxID=382380 RepID=A0ABD3R7Z5_9STRA